MPTLQTMPKVMEIYKNKVRSYAWHSISLINCLQFQSYFIVMYVYFLYKQIHAHSDVKQFMY